MIINRNYEQFIGRSFIETIVCNSKNSKLNLFHNPRLRKNIKKKFDEFEINLLNHNSIFQNDIFSGAHILFNIRKFLCARNKKLFNKLILDNTCIFHFLFQKIISGNSFELNKILSERIFFSYFNRDLIFEVAKLIKMYSSFDVVLEAQVRFSGILPFLFSFIQENFKKNCVIYFINQKAFRLKVKKTKPSVPFKVKPFVLNCSFLSMEFFGIKLCLNQLISVEHFTRKLCPLYNTKKKKRPVNLHTSCFGKIFLNFLDISDFLLILQSIESLDFRCQFFIFKFLLISTQNQRSEKNCHPLLNSMLKKIKSNFFF